MAHTIPNPTSYPARPPRPLDAAAAWPGRGLSAGGGGGAEVGPLPPARGLPGGHGFDAFDALVADMRAAISGDFPQAEPLTVSETEATLKSGSNLVAQSDHLADVAGDTLRQLRGFVERMCGLAQAEPRNHAPVVDAVVPSTLGRIAQAVADLDEMRRLVQRLQEDV